MPRRSRRKERGLPDAWAGALLTALGLVLIGALGGGYWWLKSTKVRIDAETNCPLAGPRAVHVVIFDRSDPVSPQQAQRIRQVMHELKAAARFGQRFDIYTFEGDSKNVLHPVLVVCSPGPPEEANQLIENPALVRRNYEKRFASVLDQTVEALLQETTRPTSPIIESIRAAAITSFGPVGGNVPLRVTLFSDMVQHTAMYSQFRSEADFAQLSKSQVWPSLRPDLKGAEVQVYYVLRPEPKGPGGRSIQSRGHQSFWEQLIAAGNGRVTKIEPL